MILIITSQKVTEYNNLQMETDTRDTLRMAISRGEENSFGETEWFTKGTLIWGIWKGKEL